MVSMTAPTATLTKPSGIIRNAFFTSPSSGIRYWVDGAGKATPVEEEMPFIMCECEQDWNCPLHSNRAYTAIERINDERASLQTDIDNNRWGWGY